MLYTIFKNLFNVIFYFYCFFLYIPIYIYIYIYLVYYYTFIHVCHSVEYLWVDINRRITPSAYLYEIIYLCVYVESWYYCRGELWPN